MSSTASLPVDSQQNHLLAKLSELRMAGEHEQALRVLQQNQGCLQTPSLLLEASKICLLAGQLDSAWELFMHSSQIADVWFKARILCERGELEALNALRQITSGTHVGHEFWPGPDEAKRNPVLESFRLEARDGPSFFVFKAFCAACMTPFKVRARGTFLIKKDVFCPQCFVKYEVSYDTVREFFSGRKWLTEDYCRANKLFRKEMAKLFRDSLQGREFPWLARCLNIEHNAILFNLLADKLVYGGHDEA